MISLEMGVYLSDSKPKHLNLENLIIAIMNSQQLR